VQSAWAPYQSALGVVLLTLALTAPPFFCDSSALAKYRLFGHFHLQIVQRRLKHTSNIAVVPDRKFRKRSTPHLVVRARNCRLPATFGPIAVTLARLFDGAELIQSGTPPPFFTEPLSLGNDCVYAISHRIALILCQYA
jgi:hypothetical protein